MTSESGNLERLLDEFEADWQEGRSVPDLADVLQRVPQEQRALLFEKLVPVDLEWRWRRWGRSEAGAASQMAGLPRRPLVDDYARRFPDLLPEDGILPSLIAEEYRVRHRWGDAPHPDEYAGRFGDSFPLDLITRAKQPKPGVTVELHRSAGESKSNADAALPLPDVAVPSSPASETDAAAPAPNLQEFDTSCLSSRETPASFAITPSEGAGEAVPVDSLSQIDRYEVREVLGQGGFGTVYRAWDPRLEREVALKLPHRQFTAHPQLRERFLREARAVAAIHHPSVCPVHEVHDLADGRCLLTLAFVPGQPLSAYTARGPLKQTDAVRIARQVAAGVHEAHRRGIIHRDLKPANILIGPGGRAVVTDFGLARRTAAADMTLTRQGDILGTPAYMPPEQAACDAERLTLAADVYSLGVTLFEMLTGQRPFNGSVSQVLAQVLRDDPPLPSLLCPGLDPRLDAVVLKAMAKRPEDRYASMAEFAAALKHACGGGSEQQPVSVDPPAEITVDTDKARRSAMQKSVAASQSETKHCSTLPVPVETAQSLSAFHDAGEMAVTRGASVGSCVKEVGSAPGAPAAGTSPRLAAHWLWGGALTVAVLVGIVGILWRLNPVSSPLTSEAHIKVQSDGGSKLNPVSPPSTSEAARSPIETASTPLQIEKFQVIHHRTVGQYEQIAGELGVASHGAEENDGVRVEANFRQPAWCYLVAFNPDGSEQLCHPADPAAAPAALTQLQFPPDENQIFFLTDGAGQQAFVLIASTQPLPSYGDWREELEDELWAAQTSSPSRAVLRYDGQSFIRLVHDAPPSHEALARAKRGTVGRRKHRTAFERLCEQVRSASSAEAVEAVAFPVLPR